MLGMFKAMREHIEALSNITDGEGMTEGLVLRELQEDMRADLKCMELWYRDDQKLISKLRRERNAARSYLKLIIEG